MTDPHLCAAVGGHAHVERLVQAGQYHVHEALRPVAAPAFPQFVGVPDRDRGFVGRGEELTGLAGLLRSGGATVIAQAAVGLGGAGKTALAVEFCHRHRDEFEVVRWLTAEDRQTLESQVLAMAAALGVDAHGLSMADALARVRDWFETTERRWLLVFDNVETPEVLAGLVPREGNGGVLATSRHRDWAGTSISPLPVGVLDPAEALKLLCETSGREDDAGASALVEALGCLALAVVQAGAFVRVTGWTFDRYRAYLREWSWKPLARNAARLRDASQRDVTVWTVWDASLERAAGEATGAPAVLGVLAYLGADHVPRALFDEAIAGEEALLEHGDALFIDEAIAALARYSLVDAHRDAGSGETVGVSVHRLVQEITRLRHHDQGETRQWCGTAVRLLRAAIPADPTAPEVWAWLGALEPHVLAAAAHGQAHDCELARLGWVLDRYGTYLRYSGNPLAAPAVFETAVSVAEQVFGPEHPNTLTTRNNLALSYQWAGRTGEAIALLERVLADRERLLGPDHQNTLAARNNLAFAYEPAGRTDEAIALLERVLADADRLLGPDHWKTLTARNNLAASYQSAGRTDEAIALLEQVLAARERLHGDEHLDSLTTRNNLANSYRTAGRTDEAIALLERVLADADRLLGPDHQNTLAARNNLAASYQSAGRTDEAIALSERLLADRERLHPDHPNTLTARNNLASSYHSAGRTDEAIALLEQVLAEAERLLGANHPATVTARVNLAVSHRAAGRIDEAVTLGERVLADRERLLGREHPDTLAIHAFLQKLCRKDTS